MKKPVALIIIAMLLQPAALLAVQALPESPVLHTMKLLRAHTLPDNIVPDNDDVSAQLRKLHTQFKHQVRDMIVEFLNHDQTLSAHPPSEVRAAIRSRLKAIGLLARTQKHRALRSFGHVLDITVGTPPGHPDLLALGVVLDLSWAEEQSLYILQRQPSGWVNLLSAEVNDYLRVMDAQSSFFDYVVSPFGPDRSWYLVTVSVTPHMASAWQDVTYSALSPGPDGDHPRVLVRRRHGIYLAAVQDDAHPCRLEVTANWFRVTIPVASTGWKPFQRYHDEYRVADGKARRLRSGCYAFTYEGQQLECDK